MSLTEEQKRRIEENRKKALEKRAVRLGSNGKKLTFSYDCYSSQPSVPVINSCDNHENQKAAISLLGRSSYPSTSSTATWNNSSKNICSKNVSVSAFMNLKDDGPCTSKTVPVLKDTSFGTKISVNQDLHGKDFGKKQIKGTFVLLTRKRFFVDVGYHQKVIEIFKTLPSRVYDAKLKKWNFSITDHDKLVSELKKLQPDVLFSPLPANIVSLFSNAPAVRKIEEYDLSVLDPVLLNALMPFQKIGVNFGIQCDGKVLIADDMGLGKTIQAIAIAHYFKKDWPLLVVTPSSVRYNWAESFRTWLPSAAHELAIINSGKDHITNDKIVLLSYDILCKKKDDILKKGFRSVIMDESHFIKNPKSARTKAAQIVMKTMKRIIMLSGTPALSRPIELFPQISALKPKQFSNFMTFGLRYCNGNKKAWGWDFCGSSNMEELQILLEETVMIRRLKSEVIAQLPAKRRQMIVLDPLMVKKSDNKILQCLSKKIATVSLKGSERRRVLLQYFHQTGEVKLLAVCQYIKDLVEGGKKFICFAHHVIVLDGISKAIEDLNVDYIRIDGSTSSEQRKILCDNFQLKDSCKVAVLSITAANTGITLTATSLVVFAELFWNPGILTQAEDRAHRIGQEDSVIIQYLVAKGTADDEIWPLVQRKLNVLNRAGLSKDNFSEADTVVADCSSQPNLYDFWLELDCEMDSETVSDSTLTPSKRLKLP